jgi:TonB family protein
MKQALCAVILFVAVPAFVHPQNSAPVVTLEDSLVCGHKSVDRQSCITPPQQTYSPQPKYPEAERHARREGAVKLKLVVRSDGVPSDVTVSQTLAPDFDNAALDAVRQWRFSPATKGGTPIPVQIAVEVDFSLHR